MRDIRDLAQIAKTVPPEAAVNTQQHRPSALDGRHRRDRRHRRATGIPLPNLHRVRRPALAVKDRAATVSTRPRNDLPQRALSWEAVAPCKPRRNVPRGMPCSRPKPCLAVPSTLPATRRHGGFQHFGTAEPEPGDQSDRGGMGLAGDAQLRGRSWCALENGCTMALARRLPLYAATDHFDRARQGLAPGGLLSLVGAVRQRRGPCGLIATRS